MTDAQLYDLARERARRFHPTPDPFAAWTLSVVGFWFTYHRAVFNFNLHILKGIHHAET